MAKNLLDAGQTPVCFVWETGLIETIGSNLSKLSQTKLFNKVLKVLLKKLSGKLGYDSPSGRGTPGKMLSDSEVDIELSKPNPFVDYSRSADPTKARGAMNIELLSGKSAFLEAELKAELRVMIEQDSEFVTTVQQTKVTVNGAGSSTGARGFLSLATFIAHVAKIAFRVISRFIDKRDHDLYPTVIEEILREFYIAELGAWVWKAMKDKADNMWNSNTEKSELNQYAGRYFLEKLMTYSSKFPDTEISIVGHSAGAIVACNLLKYTAGIDTTFAYVHIIFLAPACRIELFKKEIVDHPKRFLDIRIFTMNDDYECKDILVPYFYTHSLLYLISGILEDEGDSYDAYILGLERHISFNVPYNDPSLKDTSDYIYMPGKNRAVFSKTGEEIPIGMQTNSISHGGFDDDPDTIISIQKVFNS